MSVDTITNHLVHLLTWSSLHTPDLDQHREHQRLRTAKPHTSNTSKFPNRKEQKTNVDLRLYKNTIKGKEQRKQNDETTEMKS